MYNTIKNLIRRCFITLPSKEDGQYPVSQISYLGSGGLNSEELYPYGHGGVAPEGSAAILLNVGASPSNRVHIANSDLRPKNLKPGESWGGNMVADSYYIFKENGDWDVTITKDGKVTASGNLEITVSGNITINASGNVAVNSGGNVDVTAGTVNLNSSVNLGSGGQPIARVGDLVVSNVPPFPPIGTIQTGSGNHTAS